MTADYVKAVAEHIIDLREQNGELIALIEMIPTNDHLLIENVAVRPDQQGKGIGSELMRHAETTAIRLGIPEIRLYTNAVFISNLAFYARHGYEEFLREQMIPGSITVHMKKRVT